MAIAINGSGSITPSGSSVVSYPGAVLQMQAARSGPAGQTISSTSPTLITGLSISFTPKKVGSLLVFNALISSSHTHVTSFGIFKDGASTVSTSGYTNDNEANMQATSYFPPLSSDTRTDVIRQTSLMHYETVDSLTARTYGVYATAGWAGTTYSLYINNRSNGDMANFSYLTIMEIAQ